MIKFFRKIRYDLMEKNKTGKYFKYAIGEIVLVAIGILIALQVNNWNESNNIQKRMTDYSHSMISNLEQDIDHVEGIQNQIQPTVNKMDSLINYLQRTPKDDVSNLDLALLIGMGYSYKPFTWHKGTLEEIKNSGSLRYIKNDSLKNRIIEYESFTNHLIEDYKSDKQRAEDIWNELASIVDYNYSNIEELRTLYINIDSIGIKKTRELPAYKRAQTNQLILLSNEEIKLKSALNKIYKLRYALDSRTNEELQILIKDAEDIIMKLKNVYD